MADEKNEKQPSPAARESSEPTIVEKWLADQQAWQKTALDYLDSMVHNDEFLVHLGNAMRGSLLAGKPYPAAQPPGAAEPLNDTDDRIDEILHTLHLIQGELRDLRSAVDRVAAAAPDTAGAAAASRTPARPRKARKSKTATRKADTAEGGDQA